MNFLKKAAFKAKYRNVIMALIYIVFILYSGYLIIQNDDPAGKVFYIILVLVVLGISLWAEYLRHLYQKAITILNLDCDPKKAKAAFDDLLHKDFFKAYKKTVLIFDTLYYTDLGDGEACLDTIQKDDKFFRSSLDNLLVRNYTRFYAYFMLNNRTQTKAAYPEVMKLKDKKIKGSKTSPLYNWEFVEAIYQFACKDYKKSLAAFANVNPKYMNNRELAHYYYQYGNLYIVMGQTAKAQEWYEKAAALPGSNYAIMKAKESLRG